MTLKKIIESSTLSPVQLGKSIKCVKSLTRSETEYEELKKDLIPEGQHDRITQIISGLEQEDEFAILCRLMGTCQSLVGIDQTPVVANDTEKAPDFLAQFTPSCRVSKQALDKNPTFKCFIEIKSSQKETFKISTRDLNQRINFANRYGLPLIFAVRLLAKSGAALWVIVDVKYLEEHNRRLDVSALNKGIRHLLFDEYFIMPMPNLHIAHYYDLKSNDVGMKHRTFGTQVKSFFLFQDVQHEIPKDELIIYSLIADAFQPKEIQVQTKDNITVQVLRFNGQVRSICDILYTINRLATDDHGDPIYDPSRFSARFDSPAGSPKMITREMIEYYTSLKVKSKPMFLILGFEEPEQHLKRLKELCS